MKIMFLDESGDHSLEKIDETYPVFVLAGCVFDFAYYLSTVEPEIQALKQKHFLKTDIIFRSYDIRKQKNSFSLLVDKRRREAFYDDFNALLSKLEFSIIAAAINKHDLKRQHIDPDNPYHICFRFILEKSIRFLGQKGQMLLRVESRETHNDRKLAEEYEIFRLKGDVLCRSEIQSKFTDLSFNQKSQNVAGMQIADLVAYPIGKWVMDEKRKNSAFEIVRPKIYSENGEYLGHGLSVFP